MKNSSSYSAYHHVYSPSYQGYQSPSLTTFNSFASAKHMVPPPSTNPNKKILSTHSSYHCYHKKSDSMSSSSRLNSQIEIMNMKLSFDLLNHKIKQLNSIVLPKDNIVLPQRKEIGSYVGMKKVDGIKPNKFTYYNPVFSPLSSYMSYLGNTRKKYEDFENKKDSIDLSKIAGDLAETFDPSGNNSIVGLGLKEELKESNVIDKEEENKKRMSEENENDKNIKFLNDLIKSSEEKNKENELVINSEVVAFEENKDNNEDNEDIDEEKKVMLKSLKRPSPVIKQEESKNEQKEEEKKENEPIVTEEKKEEPVKEETNEEPSHKAVFSKIRNLFNNDEDEEEEQNDNEEEENIHTVEEQSNENVESEPAEETNDPPIEEEEQEESTNKEGRETDSKDNSRKKLDFSEEQEDEKSISKSSEKENKEEEEEEDEDAIFAEIIQKAKELEELNTKKSPPQEQPVPLETPMKSNQKIKKCVTFSEDKKVFIQFHENDMITNLNIIDSNGKESSFKPIEFTTYLNSLKSPLKLRPIIQNYTIPDTPSKNTLHTLISESDKEHSSRTATPKRPLSPMKDPKSPMRRNIKLIQTIEDYKKKGMNYPRVKKPRAHTPIPQHQCRKFKENPQKFFTEDLCENVLKAYDLKKKKNNSRFCKSESKNVIKVEKAIKKEKKENTNNTMYNIKKYFEENTIDKEDNLSDH